MPEPSRHAYFPFIDGLRAIAVLAVVAYHLNSKWLPGGFAGVDMFFVISGFVVSSSVGSSARMSIFAFEVSFLARRLQRIAPALCVCLAVTALVSMLIVPAAWLSANSQVTGRYAFFGFSNVVLARNANAYFSPITEFNAYTHTWSLGVEEQFYLVFPLLFWAWTLGKRWRACVAALFAGICVASLAYAWHERSVDALQAFYLLPSRFWELAAGVLLYQGLALSGRRFDVVTILPTKTWKTLASFLALCLVGYGLIFGAPDTFPAPGAIVPVIGTVALLGLLHGMPASEPWVRALTWAPVRFVGRISYSLYLWHWPVFVIFRWTYGLETLACQAAAAGLALLLAIVSWSLVENPIRRAKWVRSGPRWAVALAGIFLLYGSYLTARYFDRHQPYWSISTVARHAKDWYPDQGQTPHSAEGCAAGVSSFEPLGEGVRASYQRTGCEKPVTGPNVFAIGDSHAMAFGSMYAGYVLQTGATVVLYNNGGCPFLSLQPAREADAHCVASAKSAFDDMISRVKPGDVVFLPSLRLPRIVDQYFRFSDDSVRDQISGPTAVSARAQAVLAARGVLDVLHRRGVAVLLEAPNILLPSPAFRCADSWTRSNPICVGGSTIDRDVFLKLRQPVFDAVSQLAASTPNVAVFDPVITLCPEGRLCDTYRDGRPMFFDGDHVSAFGNSLLLAPFTEAVRRSARLLANQDRP